ncbi:hypothetical protein LF65_05692 [Clostridium beijerinckii]|uniref:SprT-like domain-containing protein n=1 Tax=Clostridium beijerinckii TaxID=1520 RepID=A0A0B5QYW7_CLOBE|nr:hypothetical protein [Clostridium beijerinckii]AJH02199.1 hypothetical protein LF65_05692 [Clostridium beijerinckii]
MERGKRKEINKLLDKLLKMELEELRKRFRPYKRRPFLDCKVIIALDCKYKSSNALGYYINTQKDKMQHRYIHKIFITGASVENYFKASQYKKHKQCYKRCAIDELRSVIRHELMHAFVYEEFDSWYWSDIKNINSDYSPIFLSCLYWGGGSTGHNYAYKFLESELYSKIEKCFKYDHVRTILLHHMFEFERIVGNINRNQNEHNVMGLEISFNDKGAGFKKLSYIKAYVKYKENGEFKKVVTQTMTLGIGFLVTPPKLLENYKRIFDNGAIANAHIEEVLYADKEENFKKPVIIFEK